MLKSCRKSSYSFQYRLTVLGDKRVGKTSIIQRLVLDSFSDDGHGETVEEHTTYVTQRHNDMYVCLIVETAGCNDFPAMRRLHMTKGDAFFVVFAVDDRRSFAAAKRTIDEIKAVKKDEQPKIFLIANKTDVTQRTVSESEGLSVYHQLHREKISARYFEVSAKSSWLVKEAFDFMLDLLSGKSNIAPTNENSKLPPQKVSLLSQFKKLIKISSFDADAPTRSTSMNKICTDENCNKLDRRSSSLGCLTNQNSIL